ncbi:MAG: hypothetical protein PVI30_24865 [Myxococcales bacterium]|jgi:hypothetical protein
MKRTVSCIGLLGLVASSWLPSVTLAQDSQQDFDPDSLDPEAGLVGPAEPQEPVQATDDEAFDPSAEPALEVPEETPEEGSGGAFLLAGKVGGGVPFNGLDVNVAGAIEVGYLFSRRDPSFGLLLDVSYFVPQSEGTATDPRLTESMGGSYDWRAWQKELVFQPTFLYRLTALTDLIIPYAGIGPRVYLLETVVEGTAGGARFPVSKEVSTQFGFGVPVGAELPLGPGSLMAELLFQWGPLGHELTGDTHLSSGSLWVGYRALL